MKPRKNTVRDEEAAMRHEIVMACASLGFLPFKQQSCDKKKEEGKKPKP